MVDFFANVVIVVIVTGLILILTAAGIFAAGILLAPFVALHSFIKRDR